MTQANEDRKVEERPLSNEIVGSLDTNRKFEDASALKFRLSSDAVLKSVGELFERKQMYPETPKVFDFECKICKKRLGKWEGKEHIKKHNLSESSKIVICEGYYV